MIVNVPATVEAEALSFAQVWIAERQDVDMFQIGCSAFHPQAGRMLLRRMMKEWALSHPFNMTTVAEYARAGWDDADLALRELIAEMTSNNKPLPPVLTAYNLEL